MIYVTVFIIGTILGSFYNVVGYRIPKGESIIFPSSHCPKCNHKLKFYELIPILSYIIQKGKCKKCQKKIPIFYPIFELITGLLFALTYKVFGLTPQYILAITFISMLIIITISDLLYMIIPDSVLIFFTSIIIIEKIIIYGLNQGLTAIINGLVAFLLMLTLKKLGDILFKKESMGGGDIKLMFTIGMTLNYQQAILSVFAGSIIGLPISIIMLKNKKEHIIPFGPLISIGAIIILLGQINISNLL